MNRNKTALTFAAVLLLATSAMAQGRGGGRTSGVSGAAIEGVRGPVGASSGGNAIRPKPASLTIDSRGGSAPGARSPVTLLDQNAKLESRLAKFFPPNTDLPKEGSGFKNLGQFVSAVHVSHNLGISFDEFKCTELGTNAAMKDGGGCPASVTNSVPMSLSKVIQTFRPDAKPQQEIKEANNQAEKDLQESAHH